MHGQIDRALAIKYDRKCINQIFVDLTLLLFLLASHTLFISVRPTHLA